MIDALLREPGDVTAAELAERTGISVRTVHRELAEVENALDSVGVALQKRAGVGIRLYAPPEKLEALHQLIRFVEPLAYSDRERRVLLLAALLEQGEPVKLFALAHEFHVTTRTVTIDLDALEGWANAERLTFVRRRGFGVQLEGAEADKRRAIVRLLLEHLDEDEWFRGEGNAPPLHAVGARLLPLLGRETFFRIERALWTAEGIEDARRSETAYTRMLVQLSVAATRFVSGFVIEAPASGEDARDAVDSAADEAVRAVEAELGLEFPPAERAYFRSLLEASKDGMLPGLLSARRPGLLEDVQALIHAVEARLGAPLSYDRQLAEGLVQHMEPALRRIEEGLPIRNPLLPQIKRDYEALFAAVKAGAEEALPDVRVPDEEIGFLAMHFGASTERLRQLPRTVRALLVCTSGIGSSAMLAMRLTKELPQIELIGRVSWYEAARVPPSDYDLIISTVDLPIPPERYVKLSPLLSKDETEKLRTFIHRIALRQPQAAEAEAEGAEAAERLLRLRAYTDEALGILNRFRVVPLEAAGDDLRSLLHEACRTLLPEGRAEAVAERLLDRERQGSIVVAEAALAFFHARSPDVDAPIVALFRLARPIALEGDPSPAKRLMLMLAPERLERPALELLSEISAMLLQADFIERVANGDDEAIRRLIVAQLENYVRTGGY